MDSAAPISSASQLAQRDACARCQRLLPDLPTGARYCPKCGGDLPVPALPIASTPTLRERMEQLQDILKEHLGANSPTPSLDQIHSLALLGYANAMLQLGSRYERGLGVSRNTAEADRCYTKSARLGNIYAKARLADKAVTVTIEDETPVPVEALPATYS
jgi:TPR repeat protein